MSRTIGVGRRSGRRSDQTPQTLSANRPVLTAYWYVIGSTGNVRSVVDWNGYPVDGHLFDQSDTSKQCAPPAAHADYAGRLCYTFTGVEWYKSTRSAAYWAFQHNGVSTGAFFVCTPTAANNRLVSSRNSSSGFLWGVNNPTNWLLFIGPGVVLGPGASLPLSVPRMISFRYTEGAPTPEFTYKVTGASAVTGDGTTPSAGNPDGTMTLGANPDASLPFVGRFAFAAFPPDLGAGGMALMQAKLTDYYGVAA